MPDVVIEGGVRDDENPAYALWANLRSFEGAVFWWLAASQLRWARRGENTLATVGQPCPFEEASQRHVSLARRRALPGGPASMDRAYEPNPLGPTRALRGPLSLRGRFNLAQDRTALHRLFSRT